MNVQVLTKAGWQCLPDEPNKLVERAFSRGMPRCIVREGLRTEWSLSSSLEYSHATRVSDSAFGMYTCDACMFLSIYTYVHIHVLIHIYVERDRYAYVTRVRMYVMHVLCVVYVLDVLHVLHVFYALHVLYVLCVLHVVHVLHVLYVRMFCICCMYCIALYHIVSHRICMYVCL